MRPQLPVAARRRRLGEPNALCSRLASFVSRAVNDDSHHRDVQLPVRPVGERHAPLPGLRVPVYPPSWSVQRAVFSLQTRARTAKLWVARPMRPVSSKSCDSAKPHPLGARSVRASTQIHSPSGRRSRLIVRSEFTKM